jgi:hypothetical protein
LRFDDEDRGAQLEPYTNTTRASAAFDHAGVVGDAAAYELEARCQQLDFYQTIGNDKSAANL